MRWSVFLLFPLAACTFGVGGVAGEMPDGGGDLASGPDGDVDGGRQPPPCNCSDANTLQCSATFSPCMFGCSDVGGAHCQAIHPSGGAVTDGDLVPVAGLVAVA